MNVRRHVVRHRSILTTGSNTTSISASSEIMPTKRPFAVNHRRAPMWFCVRNSTASQRLFQAHGLTAWS